MVSGALGHNFGKSFRYFLMDSWEAGVENWTDDMMPEFQKRRGYDPTTLSARADGPHRGERGGQRSLPVGFPPHHRRHAGGESLRRGDQILQPARRGTLRGSRWAPVCRPPAMGC